MRVSGTRCAARGGLRGMAFALAAWGCHVQADNGLPGELRQRADASIRRRRSMSAQWYVTLSALSWDPARLGVEEQPRLRHGPRATVRRRPRQEHPQGRPLSVRGGGVPAERRAAGRAGGALGVGGRPHPRRPLAAGRALHGQAGRDGGPANSPPMDVVFSFNLVNNSPKKAQSDYWAYIDRVEARDARTVVFHFNEFNAEWPYRFGYGYQSSIVPREHGGRGRQELAQRGRQRGRSCSTELHPRQLPHLCPERRLLGP